MKNPTPCPSCQASTMGPWQPVDAYIATITGNEFRSTCSACGAVEMRQKKPREFWMPAEPERRRA